MALADLFDGAKFGMDMYFQPENEANSLAKQRLALAGLEQKYADDMYLKPSELADRLATHQYNAALANANTSSLAKLRPLEDANKAATLTLDTSQLGTAQQIQNATAGTQVATGIAKAKNDLFGATNVTPSEQRKQIASNVYSTQDYGIKTEIAGKTRGDNVQKAKFTANTERNTAEGNNQESQYTIEFFRQNPDIVKNVAMDKIATAITTGQWLRITSADKEYQARLGQAKQRLLFAIEQGKQNGIPAEQAIREAQGSGVQIQSDAAASILQDIQKADTEMKLEALKGSGRGEAQADKVKRRNLAGDILSADISQLAQGLSQRLGVPLTRQQDGSFAAPNGKSYSEDKIRQIVAQENNVLSELLDLGIKRQRLENGGVPMYSFGFGGIQ